MAGAEGKRRYSARMVEDEEYERRHERVTGIDVGKASAVACTRLPPEREGGRRRALIETVEATVPAITELAGRLLEAGVEMVTLESTSDYWRVWFYVLEAAGLQVQLVSSSQARRLAGRPKTDALDAQWLARLTEMGLLRPSFVPPGEIRELRDWTRTRLHLVQGRTREWQRLEKLLEGALIKVSSVASSLTTLSAQDMIRALIAGERDPRTLAGLARNRMRAKREELERALSGTFDDHHASLAQLHLDYIGFLDREIARLDDSIEACLDKVPAARGAGADGTVLSPGEAPADAVVLPAVARLAEIPGVSEHLARVIIAEIGLDMDRFPTPGHLVSWAGLVPQAAQSGKRRGRGQKGQGDGYARNAATQAAHAAAPTKTFLGERYQRVARRRGRARAQVAVARSILVIIWHLLKDPTARFTDLGWDHYARKVDKERKLRGHLAQIQALGYEVTITPAA